MSGAAGRRPRPALYWFDPTCDRSAGLGHGYTPVRAVRDLAADLEALPLFLGGPGDIVAVGARPHPGFLRRLAAAGFALPELAEKAPDGGPPFGLAARPLDALRPWGWSPVAADWAAPLFRCLPAETGAGPDTVWNEPLRQLYSKVWSVGLLGRLLARLRREHPEWAACVCGPAEVGRACASVAEVEAAAEAIRREQGRAVLVKAPFGASGQDQVRLAAPPSSGWDRDEQVRHVERLLGEQGAVVVEPLLARAADLSLQVRVEAPGQVRVLGHSRFRVDRRGQYRGAVLHPVAAGLEGEVAALLWGGAGKGGCLEPVSRVLADLLAPDLAPLGYTGPLGIDMLAYATDRGPRLKPVVEVNPRYTMGHVALCLRSRVAEGVPARWAMARVGRGGGWRGGAAGLDSPLDLARHLERHHPVELGPADGEGPGRLCSGALCTNDPGAARSVLSVLLVGAAAGAVGALPDG